MSVPDTHAKQPDIRSAYKAVVAYLEIKAPALTQVQLETARELKHRLKRLENDCNSLIRVNNALLDAQAPQIRFDESTDTLTVTMNGASQWIKLARADPDIPIKIGQPVAMGAYQAGHDAETDKIEDTELLRRQMEQSLEGYYENAFRITKLAAQLTARKKYDCSEIRTVRCKLIDHPDAGSIYSFGSSSTGPVVKPIQNAPREAKVDAGLVPNTVALVTSLTALFASSISNQ